MLPRMSYLYSILTVLLIYTSSLNIVICSKYKGHKDRCSLLGSEFIRFLLLHLHVIMVNNFTLSLLVAMHGHNNFFKVYKYCILIYIRIIIQPQILYYLDFICTDKCRWVKYSRLRNKRYLHTSEQVSGVYHCNSIIEWKMVKTAFRKIIAQKFIQSFCF